MNLSPHDLPPEPSAPVPAWIPAFSCPRQFGESGLVYYVISPRARGLSIGVNLNPDQDCNFDCIYCEVDRKRPGGGPPSPDPARLARELAQALEEAFSGRLAEREAYRGLPPELLQLRHVALSGDGEPTLCPGFKQVVETVIHLRAVGNHPFFPMVLLTNGSALDQPAVRAGLDYFHSRDEVWVKLDGGSPGYLERVNRPKVPLDRVFKNLLELGRQRPIVIQSLFVGLESGGLPGAELEAYVERLSELRRGGARIRLVQVYSASRPAVSGKVHPLPLRRLSAIARAVREQTGLAAEVF